MISRINNLFSKNLISTQETEMATEITDIQLQNHRLHQTNTVHRKMATETVFLHHKLPQTNMVPRKMATATAMDLDLHPFNMTLQPTLLQLKHEVNSVNNHLKNMVLQELTQV